MKPVLLRGGFELNFEVFQGWSFLHEELHDTEPLHDMGPRFNTTFVQYQSASPICHGRTKTLNWAAV
jgi:hypothetical protein